MFQTNTIQADTKILDIMPVIGFGTWEITGKSCIESVKDAIHMGYRHIDTAQMYTNEKEVGKGIRQSGIEREELFVTTKIATNNLKPDLIRKTAIESLTRLNMDYVDLLLIHWPTPDMDLRACLETMFELKEQKRIKHVGVSNFDPELFEQAIEIGPVINNQVKFTPHHTQMDNLAVARKHNKIITAYSPLERGSIVKDSTLEEI
ncbi:MAG: aldo/keto reductase [Bacteroidota bacterium]